MFRGLIATTLMVAAAVEPVVNDTDLVRYGLTQGGLLAVVLVLLWSYRKDMVGKLADRDNQLSVMTALVSKSTEALMKSGEADIRLAEAGKQNADAIAQMARAIESMNTRRREH